MSFPFQGWLQAFQILSWLPWEGDLKSLTWSHPPYSGIAAHSGVTSASSCPPAELKGVLEGAGICFLAGGPGPGKPGMRAIPSQMITVGPRSALSRRSRAKPSEMEGCASSGEEGSFCFRRGPTFCLGFLVLSHH